MNPKFYTLPPERQRRMVNAGYRVFAQNPYRKAPMAAIAAEAGISKALLFHYFGNKLELYAFLWAHACQTTAQVMQEHEVTATGDLFELLRRALRAKCAVMEQFPWLWAFAARAYYEQEPDVRRVIHADYARRAAAALQTLQARLDPACLRPRLELADLYREILWSADGCLHEACAAGRMDPGKIRAEFEPIIDQWERACRAAPAPKEAAPCPTNA